RRQQGYGELSVRGGLKVSLRTGGGILCEHAFANRVIVPVRHEDVPGAVRCDAPGTVKLGGAAASVRTPVREGCPTDGAHHPLTTDKNQFSDRVQGIVYYIKIILLIRSNACGPPKQRLAASTIVYSLLPGLAGYRADYPVRSHRLELPDRR